MSEGTNPVERVVEKVKGTAKEAAGTITGNQELRREGEEQEQAAMRGPEEAEVSAGGRSGRETGMQREEQYPLPTGPARPPMDDAR